MLRYLLLPLLLAATALSPHCAASPTEVDASLLARVAGRCPRIRAPPTNSRHQLVHIHTFEKLGMQARVLCARYGVAEHRCGVVEREILATAHEMAALDVSEAVVNVTLDFSLSFSLTQPLPPPAHQVGGGDTPTAVEETVVGMLTVLPEEPLELTIASHCAREALGDAACLQLYINIESLVAGIWGCDNATALHGSSGVDAPVVAAHEAHEEPPETEPSRLVLTLESDDDANQQTLELALDAQADVDLQVALFCRSRRLLESVCGQLLRRAHSAAQALPAFQREKQRRAERELWRVNVTSPTSGRLYPASSRVYLEFEPPRLNMSDNPQLCLFIDYETAPALCNPELFREPKFFNKLMLPVGHHFLLFATIESDRIDATRRIPSRTINDSEWSAAVHFDVAQPRLELQRFALESVAIPRTSAKAVYLSAVMQTWHFDIFDTHHRLCVLHNDIFSCMGADAVTIESDTREDLALNRSMVLRAPIFNASSGVHDVTFMLLNEFGKAFAHVPPFSVNVHLEEDAEPLVVHNTSLFVDATTFTPKRPVVCPEALRESAALRWICELWRHEWGVFSQNGEDGVLQSIFRNIGVRYNEYVEFGTEDGSECNTRYLREVYNWTGLLMDGRHENAAINLRREYVAAENINALFVAYEVSPRFDLLSVDVDFNDYWILDAIDLTRFAPRVIVCEYNSHIPPPDARTVKYNATRGWDDFSDYFGVSASALERWGHRNDYSLVYCESHGVNCFLVHNAALGMNVSAVLQAAELFVPPNFFGKGWSYPNVSRAGDEWVEV